MLSAEEHKRLSSRIDTLLESISVILSKTILENKTNFIHRINAFC